MSSAPSEATWHSGFRAPLWGLWILVFAAWLRIWSLHWLSNDDLNFAARAHRPPGPLSPVSALSALRADIGRRNGRSSDVLAGILFTADPIMLSLALALLCTLAGAAAWRWIRLLSFTREPSPLTDLLLAASCAAAPFAVTLFNPRHAKETIYFLSATVGYVIGPLLLFLASGPLVRQTLTGRTPRWRLYASLPLVLAAAYHHEVLAMMLAGTVLGCLLLWKRERWTLHTWAVSGATLAIAASRFAAPGLWARSAILSQGNQPDATLRLSYAVRSLTAFVQAAPMLTAALSLGACLLGLTTVARADRSRQRIIAVLTGAAGILGLLLLLITVRTNQLVASRPTGAIHTAPSAIALLAVFALFCAALLGLSRMTDHTSLMRSQSRLPAAEEGPMTGFTVLSGLLLGSLAIPLAAGGSAGRPTYLAAFVVVLFSAAAGGFAVQHYRGSLRWGGSVPALALLLAGMSPVTGLQAWASAQPGLAKNHRAWKDITRQVKEAKEGKISVVNLPRTAPAPAYAGDWPARKASPYAIRVLYDLPENVKVKVVAPPSKKPTAR